MKGMENPGPGNPLFFLYKSTLSHNRNVTITATTNQNMFSPGDPQRGYGTNETLVVVIQHKRSPATGIPHAYKIEPGSGSGTAHLWPFLATNFSRYTLLGGLAFYSRPFSGRSRFKIENARGKGHLH